MRLTNGLCSISASNGRLFTQAMRPVSGQNKEVCLALNLTNGTELWATPVETASYPDGGVGFDDGPRSTPSVAGDSVYVLTSYLKLFRLNVTNGAVIWQKDLVNIYLGTVIPWQNAASPVIEEGLIYVNANSAANSVLALRASDGELAWRSQTEGMTHSTPVLATIQGVRQLILATQSGLLGLNPSDGSLLWRFPYPFVYGTSLGASPVVGDDMVFVSGAHAYGMGSAVVRVTLSDTTWSASQLWFTNTVASHWMTPVYYQGFLYGQFGIQSFDSTTAQLKCIDMRTGAQKWSTNNFGRGGTVLVNNHLVTVTEQGLLVLAKPVTNAYTELGRFRAITNYHSNSNKCWTVPAVVDGKVCVRSTAQAACFDLLEPDLKLAPPELLANNKLRLTAGTVNGQPVTTNRFTNLQLRAASRADLALTEWIALTNALVLTNGKVRVDNLDTIPYPSRFYLLSEP